MEWYFLSRLSVAKHDARSGVLVLEGPSLLNRIGGGVGSAGAAGIALRALQLARVAPGPVRLLPLAVAGIGGLVAVIGAAGATASYRVTIRRGHGIEWRWRIGPGRRRTRKLAAADLKAVEVVAQEGSRASDSSDFPAASSLPKVTYRLQATSKGGKVIPIEEFLWKRQALRRLASIQALLQGKTKPRRPARMRPATVRRA